MADAPPGTPAKAALDADAKSLAVLAASVAAVVVGLGLARSIPRTIAALAVATLIALGLDPVVAAVERRVRVPRGVALGSVLAVFGIAFAALAVVLVPSAADQVRDLDDDLPTALAELADLPLVGERIAEADLPARLERTLDDLPARLTGEDTPVVRVGRRAADGAVAAIVTLLLAVTLALDGRRLFALAMRCIPSAHRHTAERVADIGYRAVGRYVIGSLSVAVVAGLFTLTLGLLLGVPLAPLLALWVMVWNLVPQIGGAAGAVPFVALALTQGAVPGVIAAVAFVVYLQIENNLLGPLLVGSAVKLSPPATMTAALIGVSAGGVVGALLAVPLVGAAKAVYLELRPTERR